MSISAPASNERAESTRHADAPPAESRRSLVNLDDMQDFQQRTAGRTTPRADANNQDLVLDFSADDFSTESGMQTVVTDGYTRLFSKLKEAAQGGSSTDSMQLEGDRQTGDVPRSVGSASRARGEGEYANPEETLDAETGERQLRWSDGLTFSEFPNGRGRLTLPDGRVQSLAVTEARSLHRDADGRISVKDRSKTRSWKYDGKRLSEETTVSGDGTGVTKTYAADNTMSEKHFGPEDSDNYRIDRNAKGQVDKVVYPDGTSAEFTYNENGDVRTYRDRDGVTWTRTGKSDIFVSDKRGPFGLPGFHNGEIAVDDSGKVVVQNDSNGTETSITPDGTESVDLPNLDHNQFSQLLDQNWDRIDTDNNGRISKDEVDTAVTSNCFAGEDAQMVAALKRQFSEISKLNQTFADRFRQGISREDVKEFGEVTKEFAAEEKYAEEVGTYIDAHYDDIDANNDGQIEEDEVEDYEDTSGLSDQEKDMLKHFRNNYDRLRGDNDTVDRGMLEDYSRVVHDSDEAELLDGVDRAMNDVEQSVEDQNRNLYGSEDPFDSIKPDAINQGSIGDCYFLAAVASMAASNPEAIRDMIKDHGNGTFTVTFPGDEDNPITVNAPTDAELSLYATSGEYGVWPAVLEKAYGDWKDDTIIPQEGADGGGQIDEGIDLLTGRDTDKKEIKDFSEEELDEMLTDAFRNHESVTVNVRSNPDDARGGDLPKNHAYSVIGYDSATGTVTIRNPWGNGELKDENGRPLDGENDGVFTVSLEEFRERFKHIAIEGRTY